MRTYRDLSAELNYGKVDQRNAFLMHEQPLKRLQPFDMARVRVRKPPAFFGDLIQAFVAAWISGVARDHHRTRFKGAVNRAFVGDVQQFFLQISGHVTFD